METKFDKTLEILLELKISKVMKKEIITMSPNDKMSELRNKLRDSGISGLPVVNDDKLVGIISIEDLIRWLWNGKTEATIGETMVKNPKCIYADQPVFHAVRKFDQLGFGRFPVLDRATGKLVGIITKGDIIEETLRELESEYKEEEIRQYRASHIFEDIPADQRELCLTYEIKGKDFENAGRASTTLKKNLKRLGIHPDIIRRIAISSFEAEMNVVIYSDGGTMRFCITSEEVSLVVEDHGQGIEDIEKAMQPGYTTSDSWVKELGFGAGMGLCNIKKCSDVMDIESTPGVGTTLSIKIFTGVSDETK